MKTITDWLTRPLPFFFEYLRILAIDSLIVLLLALLFGGLSQITNFYFISSVIFFIVAVIPVFSEVGGNFRVLGRITKGEKMGDIVSAQEEMARSRSRTTYLFALCGLTTFILSIAFLQLF